MFAWLRDWLYSVWMWFLAFWRLDDHAVCWMSAGRGPHDGYHDYPDSIEGVPAHFVLLTCRRCGQRFYI